MKMNVKVYKIVFMSDILGVSPQGYYNHMKSLVKPYRYEFLLAKMLEIISDDECNDTYGSMRMWEALHYKKSLENGKFPDIPHERTIYRIMQMHGLIHAVKHKPNGITKADREAQKSDNLIKRDFTAEEPLTKAITDITELPTADGKLYISGIFDCYDLMPIGLAMADNMRAELCVETIESVCNKFKRESSINKKEFLNSPIVWFLNGKYTIIDAWSYYVFFRKNRSKLVLDSQNLFFSLYNEILQEQLDNVQLNELINLISELKSVECRNILSLGYSDYYHYLCDWLKWLIKKSLKTKIVVNNLGLFSDFCIHSINEFSTNLLQYSKTLFERVQRLDLIDITLEKLEQHLKCFSIIEEYHFEEHHMKNIFNYLQFSLKIGNKWCDITIIEKVLQICELIVKKGVQRNYLSNVFYDEENNMLCKFSFTHFFETILEQYSYVYQFYQDEKTREEKSRMENVKIGIITALPKEFAAMEVLLDSCIKKPFEGKGAGHQYLIGEILSSNGVVLQIALQSKFQRIFYTRLPQRHLV